MQWWVELFRSLPPAMKLLALICFAILIAIFVFAVLRGPAKSDVHGPSPAALPTASPTPVEQLAIPAPHAAVRSTHSHAEPAASVGRDQIINNGPGIAAGAGSTFNFGPTADAQEKGRRQALIASIMNDWVLSNDGIPPTEAGRLDKATDYINEQLALRDEPWRFDLKERKALGYAPPLPKP